MKNIFFKILLLTLLISCHKQEYYQINPNAPTKTTPALLLTGICVDVFNAYPVDPAYAARYLTYYERPTLSQNYGWEERSIYQYNTLRQVNEMEKLATKSGETQYLALAKFFRAVLFSQLTETFGEVPYSEALKGEEGIIKPVYDAQESIYKGLLDELEAANVLLTGNNETVIGDIIYGGKASQWQKAINAFRLRLLIHLSKKENNTNLNVKQQFANIVDNPTKYPLMLGTDDNAQITFNITATDNYYPTFNNLSFISLVSLEKGLVKLLKDRNDLRLFNYGDPIVGKPANDFASYEGVDGGLIISDQQNAATTASKIHRRYVNDEVNEPLILIGYSEQEFIIAEGISRGWTSSSTAVSHYVNGVRSSMRTYGIGSIKIEQYLNGPLVKFEASKAQELISTQKYLALFMQSGWEPFLEQRRTGFPTFSVGPGTLNNGQIPKRWRYPQDEYENNLDNLNASLGRQYGGTDNVNGVMWLLQ
jgi:hypothetical protein